MQQLYAVLVPCLSAQPLWRGGCQGRLLPSDCQIAIVPVKLVAILYVSDNALPICCSLCQKGLPRQAHALTTSHTCFMPCT